MFWGLHLVGFDTCEADRFTQAGRPASAPSDTPNPILLFCLRGIVALLTTVPLGSDEV